MNGSGYIEFMAAAQAESTARKKRQQSSLQMRSALGFAHTTKGKLLLRFRALLGALGPFGAVLMALYPVGLVAAIAVIAFAHAV